jgi:hypothetical protein
VNARLRRRRDFLRPLVEMLEPRRLLACQVLFENGTLTILGDESDNAIEVFASRQGILVTCDGIRSGPFPDVEKVSALGGPGNDGMKFAAAPALGPGALNDTDGEGIPEIVDFFGGPGLDDFEVSASFAKRLTLSGGEDADNYAIQFGRLFGSVRVADDGSSGQDALELLGTRFAEKIELNGGGHDAWIAKWEGPDPNGAGGGEVAIESIEIAHEGIELGEVQGGHGDDHVVMSDELGLLGGIDWTIELGEGGNQFEANLVNPFGSLSVAAGRGNDTLTTHAVWDDQVGEEHSDFVWLPTYHTGAGNDQSLITVFTRTGNIASFPLPQINIELDLAAGDDRAEILVAPGAALDAFGVLIDVGAGNDTVHIDAAPAVTELSVVVYAGRGHDTVDVQMAALPDKVEVSSGDGDDDVSIVFAELPNSPLPPRDPGDPPPEIIVDAGGGVDSVVIDVFSTLATPPSDMGDVIGQITLIEVLASIQITGVGLLALLTLFPLGALEMAQSIRDDRAGHAKTDATIAIDGAHLEVDLATGSTSDQVRVDLRPVPGSRIDLDLDQGRGDDELAVRSTSPAGPLDWTLAVQPGGGDDEVIVGFEHGDVAQPIVIGAVWNPADSPPGSRPGSTGRLGMRAMADPQQSRFDLDFDLMGSAARDEVAVGATIPSVTDLILDDFNCSASLGAGDDELAVTVSSAAASSLQKVRVDGGGGDDGITVLLRRLANPHLPEGMDQTEHTELDLRGGAGHDDLALSMETVADAVEQKVRIDGGDGNDRVSVNAPAAGSDGLADIVVGAGPGGGPHVKAFDGDTLAEARSFSAYDATFAGGVRVAAGDVNGDGTADIITGAGPGAGPHVKVFDGRSHEELASFFAYGAGFAGGVFVAAGDVNGDGRDDIITGAGAGAPGGHVKVFDGRTGGVLMSFVAYPNFLGGVNVGAGDVNGDGLSDIITGAGSGAAGGHVKVFNGRTGGEHLSFLAFPGFGGGVTVAAGDVNSDGRDDIIVGAGPGAPGGHVKVFDGRTGSESASFFAFDPTFAGGVFVAAGDLHASAAPRSLTFELDVNTGRGNDRVIADLVSFEVRVLRQFVRIDTGDGADFVRTRLLEPQKFLDDIEFPRDVQSDVLIDMGDGNDRAEAELQPTGRGGTYSYAYLLRMSGGNDTARYWVFGTELPSGPNDPPVLPLGRFDLAVHGGAGHDDIQGRVGIARGGEQWPLALADMRLSIDGGDGGDRLSLDFRGPILDQSAVDAVMRGGAGNDQVRARFELDPLSSGRLSAQVLGEEGNDELGLAVQGAEELAFLLALVDGGPGKDRCRTTPNVRVLNCP